MNTEHKVDTLLAKLSGFDPDLLLRFMQSNLQSPVKGTVKFVDARGRETEVSLSLCGSYQVCQFLFGRIEYI